MLALFGCSETGVSPDVAPSPEPEVTEPTVEPDVDVIPPEIVRGGVQGRLCLDKQTGLAGVRVAVEHEWGVAETATAVDGSFSLENLPAGNYVLVATADGYSEQIPVEIPPNEFAWVEVEDCYIDCDVPVPCIGLAEAVDRDAVTITMNDAGDFDIYNTSDDLRICMDEWVAVFSPFSQDAILGQEPRVQIGPGESTFIDYGLDVFGTEETEAWWCIERFQYTAAGAEYTYNGSLAPTVLMDDVVQRTDKNDSLVEDHAEIVEGAYIQTQMNLWDSEIDHSIVLVGRQRSLVRLRKPESTATVIVEATNLGQKPTTTSVTETVPPSFRVVDVNPAGLVRTLGDGSTSITWSVSLDAAQPIDGGHAIYDTEELTYVVGRDTDECIGRCPGYGASAQWSSNLGPTWSSFSEPLIIEVCDKVENR